MPVKFPLKNALNIHDLSELPKVGSKMRKVKPMQ